MRIVKTGSSSIGRRLHGPLYLDAGALVKLYLPEPESDRLNSAIVGRTDLIASDLALTEIVSSLSRRCREGDIKKADMDRLHRLVLEHFESGVYQRAELSPQVHRLAEKFLSTGTEVPLRAADALHLALARSSNAATIVTFDRRMAEAARLTPLTVFP